MESKEYKKEYKIDNCSFCAASTYIGTYKTLADVLNDIREGEVQCWLCSEDGHYHTEFDLFVREDGEWTPVWSGRTAKG
jgi:hypothetical protein